MGNGFKKIIKYSLQPAYSEDCEFIVTMKNTTTTITTTKSTVDYQGNLISPREDKVSTSSVEFVEEIVSAIGVQSKAEAKVINIVYNDSASVVENTVEPSPEREKPIDLTNLYNNTLNPGGRPKPINLTKLMNG